MQLGSFSVAWGRDARGRPLVNLGRPLPPVHDEDGELATGGVEAALNDWRRTRPRAIDAALERIRALPSGGWYVLDASRRIGETPRAFWVDGRELVAWRADGALRVAPNDCPHMGAPLSAGRVEDGCLVCPWHGLRLGRERHGAWEPLVAHDDGVLAWVRLGPAHLAAPRPILPARPARALDAVVRMVARCEPRDVIANRLDPWHGAHFHPHSFARLAVIGATEDVLTVRVAFRVLGPLCVEVDCTFHCPEPNTIVMTIVDGEGTGSVVETHATPLAPGWTAIVEATLATSDRPGFAVALRAASLLRPLMERSARRLWVEDAAYAERTWFQRERASRPDEEVTEGWRVPAGTPRAR